MSLFLLRLIKTVVNAVFQDNNCLIAHYPFEEDSTTFTSKTNFYYLIDVIEPSLESFEHTTCCRKKIKKFENRKERGILKINAFIFQKKIL